MSVTIRDIAREASVSTATVSKVLNDKLYVAQATRQRVLEVIERLNYTPNAAAASLARREQRIVLYADCFKKGLAFQNPHVFEIICGISNELGRKQYQLEFLHLEENGRRTEEILEEAILSKRADGMILNVDFVTPSLERVLIRNAFPQVCIGRPDFDTLLSWIDTNHVLSASIAVEHLLETGCSRIAFMGGLATDNIFTDRLKGFLISMKKHGCDVPEEYVTYNPPDVQTIEQRASELLALPQPPDAIICTNSLMAFGTMAAIQRAGLSVPEQVSVVAFDDYPFTPVISPAPTVINIDLFSLGVQAAHSLLRKIRNPAQLIQTYTTLPQLTQRKSTKANGKGGKRS